MRPKEYRIKELLREKGLDGAIVSSPENFHYVTGFGGHQHTVSRQPGFTLAVMRADDKVPTHLTTMDFEAATFRIKAAGLNFVVDPYDTWVGLKTWDEIAHGAVVPDKTAMESSMDKLVQFMKACDLANKKVGIELDYLPVPYYKSLTEKFPEAEFVNISDLFVYARSVKQPDEIEMFRKLCRIADHGFTEVSKIAKIGVSERELVQCFREDVIKSGFCAPSSWSMFSTGPSSARLTLPGDGVVKDGDVVKFDAGVNAEFDFYTTDTSRAWIIGNGDPALLKLKDRLYEGQRRMIAAAKPGLPINELYHTAYDYVKEMFPCYRRGHQGHSISMGPATAEAPYINASETRPLEAGMILAMEVPCYIDGVNGFNIEDMVLITEDGCEVLTPNTPHYL
ncbi:aminopeptidase P family protein [Clostridium sp. TM06-18]|jgi:Xaa-Pro aminopeptidase|nr:Xaa-Pro peptidase family protein [Clostridium sp. TM06-18]RHU38973.1 aminopeptidase P family protein [Clostridium sp. TM06-18]